MLVFGRVSQPIHWYLEFASPNSTTGSGSRFLAPQARQLEAAHQRSTELEQLLRTAQAQVDTLPRRVDGVEVVVSEDRKLDEA